MKKLQNKHKKAQRKDAGRKEHNQTGDCFSKQTIRERMRYTLAIKKMEILDHGGL